MAAVQHEEENMEDEEAILQRALQMSINEAQKTVAQAASDATSRGEPAQTAQQQQQEFKDLLQDNDFLKDIAKDLGIDGIDGIISDAIKKDEEQKKKEEEDKK
jgi:hypothetical protein